MPLKHVNSLFVIDDKNGKINRRLAGRFLTAGNHLHILEDYHGLLKNIFPPEGPLTVGHLDDINDLKNSQYMHVVNQDDLESGRHSEFLPEANLQSTPKRNVTFEYHHNGDKDPDIIHFISEVPYFNNVPTTHAHINSLISNVNEGLGRIRYKEDKGLKIQKMEELIQDLTKADLTEAFGKLRELVQSGHLDPEHERILAQHVYNDPMVPELGNKFAHQDFLSRPREGVHVVFDANNFKSINDVFGHEVGDQAIKAIGKAVRSAMDSTIGQEKGKVFRIGGDEFAAHVPDHESAARFARALRENMEKIEPIGGTHKLSVSMGFGNNHQQADTALYEAKKNKYTPETRQIPDTLREKRSNAYPRGATPNFAHSLVPGFEGPVPIDETASHVKEPAGIKPTPTPETK